MADIRKQKEQLAMQKRQLALKHLQSQGQKVKVGDQMMGSTVEAQVDNTLKLMVREKALKASNDNGASARVTNKATKQQDDLHAEKTGATPNRKLPSGWEEVIDESTKTPYYWNTVTNVTSWEFPVEAAVVVTSNLPPDWEEKVHPATNQKYYVNKQTKAVSHSFPSASTPAVSSVTDNSRKRKADEHAEGSTAEKTLRK